MQVPTLDQFIGNTPLVRIQRANPNPSNTILAKLEGNNPAGSVKDRPVLNMFIQAEKRKEIQPGDTLIEATSGNTGIALAMVAALRGYNMQLIMPHDMSQERKDAMRAYGATLIEVSTDVGMEGARDLASKMQKEGKGIVLDQFNNPNNAHAHYNTTGPELWQQTKKQITHFVSCMGTTGTITGTSRFLKEMNPDIYTIGLQPIQGDQIPGIRKWPKEYMPNIFDASVVNEIREISATQAQNTMRKLAKTEGIMAGISSGGAFFGALELSKRVNNATIVFIVCDRGDRYLSTGIYG